jgi:hypothetical protein
MTAAVSVMVLSCMIAAAQGPAGVSQDSVAARDFDRRVAGYVKLHKTAQSRMHRLKPTTSPAAIEEYEQRLAHRIREMRRSAVPGDLFPPEVAREFRRLIAITMQGAEAARIRQSLRRASPVRLRALRVNGTYPADVPLQSTPPSLLLNLPPLPPEIEYRLVGPTLVLRDVDANLIVDFMANAIP